MKIKTPFGKIGLPASLGALWLVACMGGTGEGNPEFGSLSVSLRAQAVPPAAKASTGPVGSVSPVLANASALAKAAATDTLRLMDEDSTPYTIQHIYAHIDQIEIDRPSGAACRSSDSLRCTDSTLLVSGSRFIDLLEHPSPLILRDMPISLGLYRQMKVRFSQVVDRGDGGIPGAYLPLIGHAIQMKGTFSYQGVPDRPLTIYLDFDDAFAFENAAGFAITSDAPYNWAGIFLASRWLNNLEITECLDEHRIALQPDGGLVIDSGTSCNENEIEDSIIENVRHNTLFRKSDD